ncbi:MAG: energy transducer TonB family protein [Stellaceae bacterium]
MRQTPEGWRERLPGPAGSLGLHLAVLLALLFGWQGPAPVEHPPIPVRIIFEPPPKPKPLPKPKPPPEQRAAPRGPIASESFGDTNPKDLGPVSRTGLETGKALLPLDVPKPVPALPKPAPTPPAPASVETAAVPRPLEKPRPPEPRPARRLLLPRRMTMQLAKYPGTAATKSEYMRYIRALVLQHRDLLPLSLIGQREGEMVVTVLVRDNGTLAAMQVSKSSGYRDIDERFERMIAAVGRFPPLPQWFQGPAMAIDFILPFSRGLPVTLSRTHALP